MHLQPHAGASFFCSECASDFRESLEDFLFCHPVTTASLWSYGHHAGALWAQTDRLSVTLSRAPMRLGQPHLCRCHMTDAHLNAMVEAMGLVLTDLVRGRS